MNDVFISYASADRARAQAIAHALTNLGLSVWWDRQIQPGQSWDQVIETALADAKCCVVLWSKTSIQSDWVKNEASEANQRKVLVPAMIDPVKIPLEFRRLQAADLTRWTGSVADAEFQRLLEAIQTEIKSAPATPAQTTTALAPPPVTRKPTPPEFIATAAATSSRAIPPAAASRRGWLAAMSISGVIGLAVIGWYVVGNLPTAPGPLVIDAVRSDVANTHEVRVSTPVEPPRTAANIPAEVEVPNLVGLPYENALLLLGGASLKFPEPLDDHVVPTDQHPPRMVINQNPPAGTKVKEGTVIEFRFAVKPLLVPDVVGKALPSALEQLGATEFKFVIDRDARADGPPNTVIKQTPAAKTTSTSGGTVRLTVAEGIVVPNLAGLDVGLASAEIEKLGFRPGAIRKIVDAQAAIGAVLNQDPAAGERVALRTSVNLEVAAAAQAAVAPQAIPKPEIRTVKVPDLIGTFESSFTKRMSDLGLKGHVRYQRSPSQRQGMIISQDPPSGNEVPSTQVVTVVVAY
ncbi:MAG: PASTA domain-containing protein [Burkholderiales bacterium]